MEALPGADSPRNQYSTYLRYRDEGTVNKWVDFETGRPPHDPLQWQYIEPNGGAVENCAQVVILGPDEDGQFLGRLNDMPCEFRLPVLCEARWLQLGTDDDFGIFKLADVIGRDERCLP